MEVQVGYLYSQKRYGIKLKVKNDFAAAKVIKLLGKGRH